MGRKRRRTARTTRKGKRTKKRKRKSQKRKTRKRRRRSQRRRRSPIRKRSEVPVQLLASWRVGASICGDFLQHLCAACGAETCARFGFRASRGPGIGLVACQLHAQQFTGSAS